MAYDPTTTATDDLTDNLAQYHNELKTAVDHLMSTSAYASYVRAQSMTGNVTLTDADFPIQSFSPTAARDLTLPAIAGTNHAFYIINRSATYSITVKNPDTSTLYTIAPSTSVMVFSDGSNGWYVVGGGGGGGTPTITAIAPVGSNITATLVTGGTSIHRADISGLTANRNFVLPAGAIGDRIELIITTGDDTYSFIIIGNTGISINGGSTATEWSRVRTAGEKVILVATSTTNWQVEVDGRVPCVGGMSDINAQNIANATFTKVTFDTANANIGGMVDLTNDRLTVWRAGVYRITAQVYYYNFAAGSLVCQTYKNGAATGMPGSEEGTIGAGTNEYAVPQLVSFVTLAAGDYVELYGRQNSGGAQNPGMKPGAPALLSLQEVLTP